MSGRSRHPEPDELLAFHFGALPDDERDPVEEHLSVCSDCAQAVLDFEAFPDLEGGPKIPPEVSRRLEDQKQSLLGMTRDAPGPSLDRSPVRRVASPGLAWALAAVFFVATVGLGVWSAGQRVSLGPDAVRVQSGVITRERGEERTLEISSEGAVITVLLNIPAGYPKYPEYQVDLTTGSGEPIASDPGFQLTFNGQAIEYTLPRGLSPGVYRLEVYGVENDSPSYLGRQVIELVSPPEEPSEETVQNE